MGGVKVSDISMPIYFLAVYLLTSYALFMIHSTGDCDSDIDCKDGYVCHQRDEWEEVYGCVGWGEYGLDYCREVKDEEEIRSRLI